MFRFVIDEDGDLALFLFWGLLAVIYYRKDPLVSWFPRRQCYHPVSKDHWLSVRNAGDTELAFQRRASFGEARAHKW